MSFVEMIELDVPAEAIILKQKQGEISSIIKINDKEIQEMKIKKDAILFFTVSKNYDNPIKPEITFFIYSLNNTIIEIIFESDDKKELKELEEYAKSILI
jgi:bisphosphoglycerate-independent phosphoglycerate mutase (AlkP superfamily)